MQVEILYDQEAETQHPECTDEAIKILEELGLESQLSFYKKNTKEIIFPFQQATKENIAVYHVNFPEQTALKDFNLEVIPFRVLEILKKAKETNRFTEFKIWHKPKEAIREDPVLVGIIQEGTYNFNFYLLARWGDALLSYAELKKAAIEKVKNEMGPKLAEIQLVVSNAVSALKFGALPTITSYNGNIRYDSPYFTFTF